METEYYSSDTVPKISRYNRYVAGMLVPLNIYDNKLNDWLRIETKNYRQATLLYRCNVCGKFITGDECVFGIAKGKYYKEYWIPYCNDRCYIAELI